MSWKLKMRDHALLRRLFICLFLAMFIVSGCTSGTIEKVDVYEMESFSNHKVDSLTSFTDSNVIEDIVKAFNKAKKEPGVVAMVDPEYKVELRGETYFLWISEEHGTIMNTKDTDTIYTMSKSSAKRVNENLNEGAN